MRIYEWPSVSSVFLRYLKHAFSGHSLFLWGLFVLASWLMLAVNIYVYAFVVLLINPARLPCGSYLFLTVKIMILYEYDLNVV